MKNKKYRPLGLFLLMFIVYGSVCALYPLASKNHSESFMLYIWIPISIIGIIFTIICALYHIEVKDKEIIIFYYTFSFNKAGRTTLKKHIIKIEDIWCIEILKDKIAITLKVGYFIEFNLHPFFKKEEIKNLFSQVRQQVIEQSKKEEKTN
ncbi:MAG: hypothetical protein IKA42_00110 [Clostridia bacterium]|nr:hypothetical protein [Clostridia bacterium]